MVIEQIAGSSSHVTKAALEIGLELRRKCNVDDVTAHHAHEMVVVTECKLRKFVASGIFLHSCNTIDDSRRDEHGKISVQRTLRTAALRCQQFTYRQRPGARHQFADNVAAQ